MLDNHEKIIEEMSDGVRRIWLYNKRMVIYQIDGATREHVDGWAEAIGKTAGEWKEGQVYLAAHDVRKGSMTPYARKRATEMIEQFPNMHGRTAIVVSRNVTGQIMAFYVNKVTVRLKTRLQRRIFYEIEDAVAWLVKLLPPET